MSAKKDDFQVCYLAVVAFTSSAAVPDSAHTPP